MTFPWNQSIPAEAVQLEARELSIKFALAAIDDARGKIQDTLRTLICPELVEAVRALNEAIEQLEGRATP